MNNKLSKFARETIKLGLSRLEPKHHLLFKRMYSHNDTEKDINEVVDDMPEEKLDWAMQQVDRTLVGMGLGDD